MLGGFQFISRTNSGAPAARQPGSRASIPLAAASGVVLLALLAAPTGPVAAEPGPAATMPGAGPIREARVSTSPEDHIASTALATRPARPMRVLANEPPLTRAAARQRVESMSPARWLERFGPVVVEHRE